MNLQHTEVRFQTADEALQRLVEQAEAEEKKNLKMFAGHKVLVEGGGYNWIWIETQPMGGEMYAKRDMEAAINNQLLFMECQREDGKLPGHISADDGRLNPHYNKLQGFCFPAPALNMYYLTGKDREYLEYLYTVLEKYDAYLWRVRDSDGDGCLETWCKFDTGEDNAVRYGDAPNAWDEEVPPPNCQLVPIASIDVMSFSYSAREHLSFISGLLGRPQEEKLWEQKAGEVKAKIRSYLWSEERGACLDRDKEHRVMPVLIHNSLRAMYFNSLMPDMADRFVREHLLNPEEFWTNMPLPSVAFNDPMYFDSDDNNWSGQPQALTYQRAIRALENYGYDWIIPLLGKKLFEAIEKSGRFVQQYDPVTMRATEAREVNTYGPAILSVLEYLSRMYGVHREKDCLYWGALGGEESVYEQIVGEDSYRIENHMTGAEAYINGKKIFTVGAQQKVITDLAGQPLRTCSFRRPAGW